MVIQSKNAVIHQGLRFSLTRSMPLQRCWKMHVKGAVALTHCSKSQARLRRRLDVCPNFDRRLQSGAQSTYFWHSHAGLYEIFFIPAGVLGYITSTPQNDLGWARKTCLTEFEG